MTDCYLIRTEVGFVPADEAAREAIKHVKLGDTVKVKLTKVRNYLFFRKWWALVNFAYDHWEEPEPEFSPKMAALIESSGILPQKNLDRFRKDIIILAGHYDRHFRVDGSVRVEPKSIAFGNMSEETFDDLYQKTIDVILKHILVNYDEDTLRSVVDQLMDFA